jgi:hypothetical protein
MHFKILLWRTVSLLMNWRQKIDGARGVESSLASAIGLCVRDAAFG